MDDLQLDLSWRKPTGKLLAWTEGKIHRRPPSVEGAESAWANRMRLDNFVRACRLGDPGIVGWPEFELGLHEYNLWKLYVTDGLINATMAGLLIVRGDRTISDWCRRAARMSAQGKDVRVRRRYRKAGHLFHALREESATLLSRWNTYQQEEKRRQDIAKILTGTFGRR